MVGQFNEMKVGWVNEMGLGTFLYFKDQSLPRQHCYWLMTRVDLENQFLVVNPDLGFPFHVSQIKWILGLSNSGKKVPEKMKNGSAKRVFDVAWSKYGVLSSGTGEYLRMPPVLRWLESRLTLKDEDEFKILFLAAALCLVFCPTSCRRLGRELFPAIMVANDCSSYDWCILVLAKLIDAAKSFTFINLALQNLGVWMQLMVIAILSMPKTLMGLVEFLMRGRRFS